MALSELENQVYSHHVVKENGFERIIPAELDPYMKGRALTLLEAATIISALTSRSVAEVMSSAATEAFQPIAVAAPEPLAGQVDSSPSSVAYNAAKSAQALNEQFAMAG